MGRAIALRQADRNYPASRLRAQLAGHPLLVAVAALDLRNTV